MQLLALQHESGLMEAQAVHQIGDAQLKKYNRHFEKLRFLRIYCK
uniref:Uncharacterized protein n=1 Tax=mine drainage metagenome TaxID=410659 RepID=E6QF48_9ZZZZ